MNKKEFLKLLQQCISGLSEEDIDERLTFNSEMIDDYIEEGLSEEDAVNRIGPVNEIAAQIVADTPLSVPTTDPPHPCKQHNPWKIAMIVLGSPIWFSLLVSAFAVVLSLYVSLWAIIVSLWSVFVALCSCAFGGVLGGATLAVIGFVPTGAALLGAGIVCAGLAILAFFGCRAATKGVALLTKKIAIAIKNKLKKKEDA